MKKVLRKIYVFVMILLLPVSVLAYSSHVIPGGENLGIEINSKGIMVIGFYKVNGKTNQGKLAVGDIIKSVNNTPVLSIQDLVNTIDNEIRDNKVELTYRRGDKDNKTILELEELDGVYKTGLYVKDNLTGIGTLTYIDPESLIYGALGHEIIESTTKNRVEVRTGKIFKSTVTNIDKSKDGKPGGKNAKFYYNTEYGTIEKNTSYGIYGKYSYKLPDKELIEVADANEVKTGIAEIRTVLSDNKIETFEITITKLDKANSIKNIHFKITDTALVSKTGGVVQGMSGSPIIQNNKLIGAVTHVVVDNVQNGYGIFITTMLEEGEK